MNPYADFLALQKGRFPNKHFLIYKDRKYTYAEFSGQVNKLGNGLKAIGVQPGDKIGIMGTNSADWIITYFSLISIGAVVVTINPVLALPEKVHIINHCELKGIVLDAASVADFEKIAKDTAVSTLVTMGDAHLDGAVSTGRLMEGSGTHSCRVEREADDPCMIFHTGGTTSLPKSAVIPHRAFHWIMSNAPDAWHVKPEDRFLISSSMSFGMGSGNILPIALAAGGTVVLAERFTPAIACELIQEHRVTVLTAVPTMFSMILNYSDVRRYDLSSLRLCFSAGAPLLAEVVIQFWQKFNLVIHDYWGLTEAIASTVVDSAQSKERTFKKLGSSGKAVKGIEVRVVDPEGHDLPSGQVGEVLLNGPNTVLEYFRQPEVSAQAFIGKWFRTGDLGYLDEDGEVFIVDRKKDIIIRGGANIYPREVEEAICKHPGVSEAAVIGVPDPVFGEQVKAYIVARAGATLSGEDIKQHCFMLLAEYKVPEFVEFLEQLPKSKATEKVLKRDLRIK